MRNLESFYWVKILYDMAALITLKNCKEYFTREAITDLIKNYEINDLFICIDGYTDFNAFNQGKDFCTIYIFKDSIASIIEIEAYNDDI